MTQDNPPNILLITCDQYRYPRFSYGPDAGLNEDLKRILGFHDNVDNANAFAKFFPGLMRLRPNSVVLRNHTIAASACTPSRATIYTGQYGTRTGVTQTDGLFKNGDTPNYPWLAEGGIPTLGTWMREAGYSTHYFGKWHVSDPPGHSLDRFGFDNWEESWPEPHGSQINNLGLFRDVGFSDAVCTFLRRQGLALNYNRAVATASANDPAAPPPDANAARPWFAVASFVNPHDIATYPGVLGQALPAEHAALVAVADDGKFTPRSQGPLGPLQVPAAHTKSNAPTAGTMQLPLNPMGFPQDCAALPPTAHEKLNTKPSCQLDYAYKMGLALASKVGFNAIQKGQSKETGLKLATDGTIPFAYAFDPDRASLDFIQLYGYLHAVVDTHIDRVLQTLEDTGQANNTIVIFLTDHGEYAAAHGMMMEKWHTAYQEILHVPVVVKFPPNNDEVAMKRSVDALTSHIDILPTILGLAGVHADARETIAAKLRNTRPVPPLPGSDLSDLLAGTTDQVLGPDNKPRQGVLFITDDEITAPLPPVANTHSQISMREFAFFNQVVDAVREGSGGKPAVPALTPGAVCQPNHIRCVRTPNYKLARYFDPSGKAAQEWEMYDLARDPNEVHNLVQVAVTPPVPATILPSWTDTGTVQTAVTDLTKLLAELEARDL